VFNIFWYHIVFLITNYGVDVGVGVGVDVDVGVGVGVGVDVGSSLGPVDDE
jgi:hypothetical protein